MNLKGLNCIKDVSELVRQRAFQHTKNSTNQKDQLGRSLFSKPGPCSFPNDWGWQWQKGDKGRPWRPIYLILDLLWYTLHPAHKPKPHAEYLKEPRDPPWSSLGNIPPISTTPLCNRHFRHLTPPRQTNPHTESGADAQRQQFLYHSLGFIILIHFKAKTIIQ